MESDAPPVVGSYAGTVDMTDNSNPDHRYGPMMQHIARVVLGVGIVLALLVAALAVSATGLQRSEEALALATANAAAIASGSYGTVQDSAQLEALAGGGAPVPASTPMASKPTFKPTSGPTSKPTSGPTSKPTDAPTGAPTEPHPLNPQWFQTTHVDWQNVKELREDMGEGGHDWHGAHMLCGQQGLNLCDYDSYCPNGQGAAPFHGGPPKLHNYDTLEVTQWSPFMGPSNADPAGLLWIQIGRLSTEDGGSEENNYIQCWKYDDWYAGNGVDIVDVWEAEFRMWMLCCERAE